MTEPSITPEVQPAVLVVFVALAVTMRLTRKLDWYAEDAPADPQV